jgi:hypothetical protein
MTASKTQLIGGHFQDAEGNLLANGYLEMTLNQDSLVSGVGNIAAGITVRVQLDANGDALASPAQYIWATDVLLPVNAFYKVTGYTVQGQPAWGPNNQQITSGGVGGGTFDLGTWIPNQVVSWVPSVQGVTLESNGTPNVVQTLQNLESSNASVIITDLGNGTVDLQAVAPPPPPPPIITPDKLKTSLWTPGNPSFAGWISGEDGVRTVDSGAFNTYQLPTASVNYGNIQLGNRLSMGSPFVYGGRDFTFMTTALWGAIDIQTFFFLGLMDPTFYGTWPTSARHPQLAQVGIYKSGDYAPDVDSSVWHCRVSDGSSLTDVTTAIAAATRSVWEIDYTPTSVVFKANGSVVATITTNIPTLTAMAMCWSSWSGYGTQTLTSEYMYCAANAA